MEQVAIITASLSVGFFIGSAFGGMLQKINQTLDARLRNLQMQSDALQRPTDVHITQEAVGDDEPDNDVWGNAIK